MNKCISAELICKIQGNTDTEHILLLFFCYAEILLFSACCSLLLSRLYICFSECSFSNSFQLMRNPRVFLNSSSLQCLWETLEVAMINIFHYWRTTVFTNRLFTLYCNTFCHESVFKNIISEYIYENIYLYSVCVYIYVSISRTKAALKWILALQWKGSGFKVLFELCFFSLQML